MEYTIGTKITELTLDEVEKLIKYVRDGPFDSNYCLTINKFPCIINIIFKEKITYLNILKINNTLIREFFIDLNLLPALFRLNLSNNPKLSKLDIKFKLKNVPIDLDYDYTRIKKLKFKNSKLNTYDDISIKNIKTVSKSDFYWFYKN